jgi:hypothetical protein
MVTVKYDDLSAAFDFVSFAAPFEHRAFVSLDTGAIYWISETSPIDEEDLPDDLETSDRYIAIPHKNELDLGNNLALRFAEEQLPHRYVTIAAAFRHRGAYARFKELLAAEGCLEKWYAFEAERCGIGAKTIRSKSSRLEGNNRPNLRWSRRAHRPW